MASPVSPILNHVYASMRLKMSKHVNSIDTSLFCHYGHTDNVFVIGGLAQPSETFMGSAIRHCRRLVNFSFSQNYRLYLSKVYSIQDIFVPSYGGF
jgi:hypothetical protein